MGGVLQLWVAKFRSNSSFFDALMVKNERRKKKNGGEREGSAGGVAATGKEKGVTRNSQNALTHFTFCPKFSHIRYR